MFEQFEGTIRQLKSLSDQFKETVAIKRVASVAVEGDKDKVCALYNTAKEGIDTLLHLQNKQKYVNTEDTVVQVAVTTVRESRIAVDEMMSEIEAATGMDLCIATSNGWKSMLKAASQMRKDIKSIRLPNVNVKKRKAILFVI